MYVTKSFMAKAALATMIAAAYGLAPTLSSAAVVVTPSSMGSWSFDTRDSNGTVTGATTGSMVTGPATPPLGTGSADLTTPGGTGDGASELRSSGYAGVALNTITALSYSAYSNFVPTSSNQQQFPYFGLVVSTDGGASVADTIFFEAPYQQPGTGNPSLPDQGPTVKNLWQTWNALAGGWWDNNGIANAGTGVMSFSNLVAAIAAGASVPVGNVTITNTDDGFGHPLGGVRFDVGFASPGDTFDGNVDNFTIGINNANTTYDFEAAAAATPLPAALPLFASGLGAMGFIGWRRKRKALAA